MKYYIKILKLNGKQNKNTFYCLTRHGLYYNTQSELVCLPSLVTALWKSAPPAATLQGHLSVCSRDPPGLTRAGRQPTLRSKKLQNVIIKSQ